MQQTRPEAVRVSVIIPTRNRPQLLVRAVASALAQDFASLEVMVVIDGEDPRTRQALADFRDERLRIIELPVSVGGADARNAGVQAARGEWVAFLDDDDEWLPHKLSRQMALARRSKAMWTVLSSQLLVRTPDSEMVRPLRSCDPQKPISEFLFCRPSFRDGPYALQTSTLMMRRELMLAVPFKSGLKRHQDWDWVLRAAAIAGVQFSVADDPLVIYHTEEMRESVGRAQDWRFSMEWGREMRRFYSAKAYSWFLATECASRAAKSRASLRVYAEILKGFVLDGRPSFGSTLTLIFFMGLPRGGRNCLHDLMRRWRRISATPSRSQKQHTLGMELSIADQ